MPNLRSLVLESSSDHPRWDLSIDPFKSFSNTLRSLSLYNIPLYPSFLRLKTLTKLSLQCWEIRVPLDAIFDVLEENHSLQSMNLVIHSRGFPAEISRRRVVTLDQLQRLSIDSLYGKITRTLISGISLRKGVYLQIRSWDQEMEFGLNHIPSDVSATHLSNLLLPTFMEYRSTNSREIRLIGPNESFYYRGGQPPVIPFVEVPVLPLTNIQELHLKYGRPIVAPHPSSFPALHALIINGYGDMSEYFSVFFPNP